MTLTFQDAKFKAQFNRIYQTAKRPEAILKAAGREMAKTLKAHFRMKDSTEPNQLGGKRQHFWLQVARSVQNPQLENPTTISVTISDPRFAQKLFGGVIRAKAAAALTIPVEKRAYGRTAATFERETGLKLILIKTGHSAFGNAVLAVADKKAKGRGLTVEYILAKSVDQKADTTALPEKTALEAAIIARSQAALDRQISGHQLNKP